MAIKNKGEEKINLKGKTLNGKLIFLDVSPCCRKGIIALEQFSIA